MIRSWWWLLVLVSCSSPQVLERGALFDILLRAYPGETGKLTNQRCKEYKGDDCIAFDRLNFDLTDSVQRKQLINLKFICDVAGERFGICLDGAALCQLATYEKRVLGIVVKRYTYVRRRIDAVKEHQFFVDANTYCVAQESDLGKVMFD